MDFAEPQQMSPAEAMPSRRAVWEELVKRFGLVDTPFEDFVGWEVEDFLFHHEYDNITSTIKSRQAGFADALNTETRLPELFDKLVDAKILPPFDEI